MMRVVLLSLAILWAGPALAVDAGASDAGAADAGPPPGPPPAKGPPPAVKMECLPTPVRIGEPLVCTLTAVHRADVSIEITAPPAFTTGEAAPSTTREDGLLETVRTLTIRPDSMRKVRVDGLAVIYTEATGGQGRLAVPKQVIATKSVLGGDPDPQFRTFTAPGGDDDADGFFARHGPLPYRVFNWPVFIGLCVLVGVGVGVGVGVLVKRFIDARRVEPGPPVDPRPAHVIAFAELEVLLRENLPGQGRVDEFYVRLSEIVRAYLQRRYGIDAPEMTSDQIRSWSAARADVLSAEVRLGLDDFLAETDLVKFADFSPSESEIDTVTRQARGFITLTKVADAEEVAG